MSQVKQKYLGAKGLIILIALLSAFVPLSTDLYLPALLKMSAYFRASADRINLTLTVFFIFYALGTLVWGPLSDHYGRKPIYRGDGIVCHRQRFLRVDVRRGWLGTVSHFPGDWRQRRRGGGHRHCEGCLQRQEREFCLAIVQSMVTISPAVAPVLGAFCVKVISGGAYSGH